MGYPQKEYFYSKVRKFRQELVVVPTTVVGSANRVLVAIVRDLLPSLVEAFDVVGLLSPLLRVGALGGQALFLFGEILWDPAVGVAC